MPDTSPASPISSIFEKAICLEVSFSRLGTRRKVSTEHVDAATDKSLLHVSKDILDADELTAVSHLDAAIRRWLKSLCVPSILRSGVYLVPLEFIPQVEDQLGQFQKQRQDLIEHFIVMYDLRSAEAKERLQTLWNPADYPSIPEIRESFAFTTQYIDFGVPGHLSSLNQTLFAREREKAEQRWAEASDEIRAVLREGLRDLIDHLHTRLTPDQDNHPKVLRKSLVDNLHTYLDTFNPRNVTDDHELAQLVEQCRSTLSGISADSLRSDPDLRAHVQTRIGEIKHALDPMITTRVRRLDLE